MDLNKMDKIKKHKSGLICTGGCTREHLDNFGESVSWYYNFNLGIKNSKHIKAKDLIEWLNTNKIEFVPMAD